MASPFLQQSCTPHVDESCGQLRKAESKVERTHTWEELIGLPYERQEKHSSLRTLLAFVVEDNIVLPIVLDTCFDSRRQRCEHETSLKSYVVLPYSWQWSCSRP
jgi:hypothetical protein